MKYWYMLADQSELYINEQHCTKNIFKNDEN